MKYRIFTICFSIFSVILASAQSQQTNWPKTFSVSGGSQVKIFEPQPESHAGNLMKIKAAASLLRDGKADPVFGVIWADVNLENNGSFYSWKSASVTNIKFPDEIDETELDQVTTAFENQIPAWNLTVSNQELQSKIDQTDQESKLSDHLSTTPPKIVYSNKPSILVLIDGEPQFRDNNDWGVSQVTNTPFTLVKANGQTYYLYGGKNWYNAKSINGPWAYVEQIPSSLSTMDNEVRSNDTSSVTGNENELQNIIVSTEPAELIQSKGEANLSPIKGTNLLYVTNSSNDIFLDLNAQQYYVLLSGRWFKAPNMNSSWTYIPSKNLPADFSRIPEGSPKDNVLASVAGTDAANESVLEAQVPQTAKVDRKNATAKVTYDGDPQFENIEGTDLRYATNTPGAVLNSGRQYYYVENGVWFQSYNANGPWTVATERPPQVEYIPARYPVYNLKYVYIYDATPDYVYMGYTPGYLGNYIYGPTIVYGTGYYYRPWRGRYYYPRPVTWGYNMRYNPWSGWGFGINLWAGWFSVHIGNYSRPWGGWWGPSVYRPMYSRSFGNYYGRNTIVNNYTIINNRQNNIYRYRRDVVTHDRGRFDNYRGNGMARPMADNNRRYNQPYNNTNGRLGNNAGQPYNNNNSRPGNNAGQPYNNNNGRLGNNAPGQRPSSGIQGNDRQPSRRYEPNAQPRTQQNNDRGNNNGGNPQGNNPDSRRYSNQDNNGQRNLPRGNANNRGYRPDMGSEERNRVERPSRERSYSPSPATPAPQADRPSREYGGDRGRSASPGVERPQRESAPRESAPRESNRGNNGGSRSNHDSGDHSRGRRDR